MKSRIGQEGTGGFEGSLEQWGALACDTGTVERLVSSLVCLQRGPVSILARKGNDDHARRTM
jgi:hypothetical protein